MALDDRLAPDVLVIGGGVTGLSCAHALAGAGARVAVLERDAPAHSTSVTAGGMLAAHHESGGDPVFLRLALESLALWPDLAATLREESGIDPEYVAGGILSLATDAGVAADLRQRLAPGEAWWEPAAVREALPGLRPVKGAVYAAAEGQVQPPRVVAALVSACARRGVQVQTGVEVTGLLVAGDRCSGVSTPAGTVKAGTVVLAAGAHSAVLAARAGLDLPVFPIRGQVVQLAPGPLAAGPWRARCLPVFGPAGYLIPRRDGHLYVGATMEFDAGFDRRVTLGGMLHMTRMAVALFPALREAPVSATWAGLRPGSPDGRPLIGPAPGLRGLWVATGHTRNGILLAPVTAQLVAQGLSGRDLSAHPAYGAFAVDRFAAAGPGRKAHPTAT